MLRKLARNTKHFLNPDLNFRLIKIPGLQKLGTKYGGWIIPVNLVNENSVCYLAGAGEDISFDTELVDRFHCPVHIFDPTPRAIKHFKNVVNELDKPEVDCLHFHSIGIWTRTGTLRFFAPKDETHVSHSIGNLQETDQYFEAPVKRLSEIMKEQGHTTLDILKLDIEGAEYDVLETVLADDIAIKILCVEFHPSKEHGLQPAQQMITKLEQNNYRVIAKEDLDFTFISAR